MSNTEELLGPILRDVSRSFYLTLRILPKSRQSIGLLYLLARTTDTIADTNIIPAENASKTRQLETVFEAKELQCPTFPTLLEDRRITERKLLLHCPEIITLSKQPAFDRGQIQLTLETITRGQDLIRFGTAETQSLETPTDLDYTYQRDCVLIPTTYCFPKAELNDSQFLALPVGKALQLINILRDLPGDLKQGRCYFPRQISIR